MTGDNGTAGDAPEATAGAESADSARRTTEAVAKADDAAHDAARVAEKATGPGSTEEAEAAHQAEDAADDALDQAEESEEEALAAAAEADELLLDKEAQEVAARVSEERPFGVPGRRANRSSPFRWGFVVTLGGLLALVIGRAVATVEHQLLLILIAVFVAIGLDPLVRFLTGKGLRRSFAVAIIVVVFLAAVGGFIAAAVPPLISQASDLTSNAPKYLQELNDRNSLLGRLNLQFHVTDHVKSAVSGSGGISVGSVLHVGTLLVSATFETVVVLVLIIYFLADLDRIKNAFYRLVPLHRRPRVGLLGDEIIQRVGGYVLGNLLTSVVATVSNYIVLLILGVPYALVLSILVGILDLVPLVGSTIGGGIVALVALATVSTSAAVITVIYHVIYRLFEDYLLNPRVLRRTVDVSPVVTVVAVVIGGALLGITGALLAVPVAAAIQLILVEVVYPKQDELQAASSGDPAPAG